MEPIRLTRQQVREVDRIAIEEYGIPGIVLMENAARNAAEEIIRIVGTTKIAAGIICGNGNNGGDGYAIARHLHNRGVDVVVYADLPGRLSPDCQTNRDIVRKMGIELEHYYHVETAEENDILIDALLGTGLSRSPEEDYRITIECMNGTNVPVCAIDIPSGLDCDTGEPVGIAVRASATVTFVAEKVGFANPNAKQYTGDISVVDIGAPREIIDRVRP